MVLAFGSLSGSQTSEAERGERQTGPLLQPLAGRAERAFGEGVPDALALSCSFFFGGRELGNGFVFLL